MFGLPKTAIAEPVEIGRALIKGHNIEAPHIVVKTMKNDKLLKSFFQNYPPKKGNVGFIYTKMFKSVQLLFSMGRNKVGFTFPFESCAESLAGMIKTKTVILEHQDLRANARLILDLEDIIHGLSDKWRTEIIPDYLQAKFKKDGIPMERFNLVKHQLTEKIEKNWTITSE